jgi:Ca-activated chloride channel family protein
MKLVTAAAFLLSLGLTGAAQFRSGVDLVSFTVVASDKQGLVEGLTRDDFTILEDGKPQTLQFFAEGDVSARMPLRLGLLFDVSGSMGLDIEMSRSAAIKFMNAVEHAKDVTLVDFDTEVRLARYRQDDFPRLIERIRSKKPDGWTALYDAIAVYLNGMAMEEGQKVLVIYSDGGDTRSRMSMTQIIDLLKWIDVTVYAIGFVEHQGSGRMEQRMKLEQLANATGGQAYFPTSKEQVAEFYDKILAELNGRYTLGYISNSTAKPGFRKVEIKVTNPAYRNIKIRARNGYYAPDRPGTSAR